MASSFSEINIAMSGLYAAQQGLAVTSNNISNANTVGYSRQQMVQTAAAPLTGYGVGMFGTGVDIVQINRVRNSYLDTKLWSQKDTLGEYNVKAEQNMMLESIFGEPSDVGFTQLFNDLYAGFDDLAKVPTSSESKEVIKQTMESFNNYFNSASQTITDYQKDLNFEVGAKVDEINMLATRIQSLNQQIFQSEMHGGVANTLRDERELIVDRLSELVNVEVEEIEVTNYQGNTELHFQVKLNGQTLVDHYEVRFLEVEVRETKLNEDDIDALYDVVWEDDVPFDMQGSLSGELRGAIDMRDGTGSIGEDTVNNYRGIPYYVNKLNDFANRFANHLNSIYNRGPEDLDGDGERDQLVSEMVDGVDANGNPVKIGVPQYALFGTTESGSNRPLSIKDSLKRDENGNYVDLDGDGMADIEYNAKELSLSLDVFESSSSIRTNYEHMTAEGEEANPNESQNDLLMDLLASKDDNTLFKEGNPKDFMISMFSELGINAKEANMYQQTQTTIVHTIENQRLSVSQVDTNEEFINLTKYNQAYQMAAKVISTVDELYNTLLFKLGSW